MGRRAIVGHARSFLSQSPLVVSALARKAFPSVMPIPPSRPYPLHFGQVAAVRILPNPPDGRDPWFQLSQTFYIQNAKGESLGHITLRSNNAGPAHAPDARWREKIRNFTETLNQTNLFDFKTALALAQNVFNGALPMEIAYGSAGKSPERIFQSTQP